MTFINRATFTDNLQHPSYIPTWDRSCTCTCERNYNSRCWRAGNTNIRPTKRQPKSCSYVIMRVTASKGRNRTRNCCSIVNHENQHPDTVTCAASVSRTHLHLRFPLHVIDLRDAERSKERIV